MTLQWTLVAIFLYVEIFVFTLLSIPFDCYLKVKLVLKSRFLRSLESQWYLYYRAFLVILILLFIDSIREISLYWNEELEVEEHGQFLSGLQHSMRLFRAERNFYISGFALFMCLAIRLQIVLIETHAEREALTEASLKWTQMAKKSAEMEIKRTNLVKYIMFGEMPPDNNELILENEANKKLKEYELEMKELTQELSRSKKEMKSYRLECERLTEHSKTVEEEKQSLETLYHKLQDEYEKLVTDHNWHLADPHLR